MNVMNEQPRKLYRSSTNRMVGGVAAGLAEYFNIDPTLVRVVMIFLLIMPCIPMLLTYLIVWCIIPERTIR